MVSLFAKKLRIDTGPPTLLELSKNSTLNAYHLTLMDILRMEIDRQRHANPFLKRNKTICFPPRRVKQGGPTRAKSFMGRENYPNSRKKNSDDDETKEVS